MKKFFVICAFAVISAVVFTGCPKETKEDKVDLPKGISAKDIRAVSAAWLEKLDKGWYSQAYDETAKILKNNLKEDQWLTNMTTYRKPLEAAKKRTEINIFY
ncbi:MAG: DUF4019 domain-containing protein, partial [Endomicrobia bacterium]|nr:DUF4019 domain-containing protein [Endomicrobiia bacterium]